MEAVINEEVVKKNYIAKIGKPTGFIKLNVRKIAGHSFRMTMYVQKPTGPGIGPSHVVQVNDLGEIQNLN